MSSTSRSSIRHSRQCPPTRGGRVGFLALDRALGEDGVTRWIGRVTTSQTRPPAGVPADGLIEAVEALAGRAGADRWALLQRQRDGAVVIALLAISAKWVDHPLLDERIAVMLPVADQTPAGLPGPGALEQLRAVEARLTDQLARRVILVAHETSRGTRTLHLYSDSDDAAVAGLVRDVVAGWPGAAVRASVDPGWRAMRHLTE